MRPGGEWCARRRAGSAGSEMERIIQVLEKIIQDLERVIQVLEKVIQVLEGLGEMGVGE